MIQVVITKKTVEEYEETQNFLVKETPTEITEESTYGGRTDKKIVPVKEYEVRSVQKQRTEERILLTQHVDDDSFDLKKVIAAINQIEDSPKYPQSGNEQRLNIPLQFALLCVSCEPQQIVDSRDTRGEVCPVCKSVGALMSLARVLNPTPELGKVTYICA